MGNGVQSELFYEDIYAAYRSGVEHCGGAKKVGRQLFPEKSPEAAGHQLMACMNPNRSEKLSEEQRILLLAIFRDAGFHGAMHYIADATRYERPRPIDLIEQAVDVQQQMESTVARMEQLVDRWERIQSSPPITRIK